MVIETMEPQGLPGPCRIRIREDMDRDCYGLYLYVYDMTRPAKPKRWVVRNVQLEENDGWYPKDPTLPLDKGDIQDLFEELWQLGFRPRDTGSVGQLAATERHLEHVRGLLERVLPAAVRVPAI